MNNASLVSVVVSAFVLVSCVEQSGWDQGQTQSAVTRTDEASAADEAVADEALADDALAETADETSGSSEPGGPELPYCGGTKCSATQFCAYNNHPFEPLYWCQDKQADGDSCVENKQCLSGSCKLGFPWGHCQAKAAVVD